VRALVPTAKTDDLVVMDDVPEVATSDDQALVAVEAFSVNRGETFLLEKPRPGWRPGKDVAGIVVRQRPTGPARTWADGWWPILPRRVGQNELLCRPRPSPCSRTRSMC
jgi:hypothetical protein